MDLREKALAGPVPPISKNRAIWAAFAQRVSAGIEPGGLTGTELAGCAVSLWMEQRKRCGTAKTLRGAAAMRGDGCRLYENLVDKGHAARREYVYKVLCVLRSRNHKFFRRQYKLPL